MKKSPVLLVLSIVINILFVSYFVGKQMYYRTGLSALKENKTAKNDSIVVIKYNKYQLIARRNWFKTFHIANSDILFIGDSQTDQFPLNEMLNTMTVRNRGIAGSASADVLKTTRILNIPRKVFLLVGINDIFGKVAPDTTISNIDKIIAFAKSKNPAVTFYVQSVLPVADKKMTEEVVALDRRIQALCIKDKVTYINNFPLFVEDGGIKPSFTVDGVHISNDGYNIWLKNIMHYIN